MKGRSSWQGMLTIARLNWPYYAFAVGVLLVAGVAVFWTTSPLVRGTSVVALLGAGWFLLGSLGVSHLVYDRSDLYRWCWLRRALCEVPLDECVFCHAGFDEASSALRTQLPDAARWHVLDHFDAATMTEPSIRRARRLCPPTAETRPAAADRWPLAADSADVVFALLAIHELRSESERAAWFAEARRCLHPGGRVVLVEHTRDFANFLAFGPGFFHFHSPQSWRRSWERGGLRLGDTFHITPWIRVFILTPL